MQYDKGYLSQAKLNMEVCISKIIFSFIQINENKIYKFLNLKLVLGFGL